MSDPPGKPILVGPLSMMRKYEIFGENLRLNTIRTFLNTFEKKPNKLG
jgi:hypothetical protein